MRARRKDANHNSIGDYLRALGWSVLDISSAGNGIPDMAVGRPGFAALIEVKDGSKPPSARTLTPKEEQVKRNWEGPYIIALSPEDAASQLALEYEFAVGHPL